MILEFDHSWHSNGQEIRVAMTTSEFADVDVVLVQQFKPQITKWHRFFLHSMDLMSIAATSHDGR